MMVRQKYGAGPRLSFADLALQFGDSKQAIHRRATVERWERVVSLAELAARAQIIRWPELRRSARARRGR